MNQTQFKDAVVQIPLTIGQLAAGLRQLPEERRDELADTLLEDEGFAQMVLDRAQSVRDAEAAGETLSLEALQKEFHA